MQQNIAHDLDAKHRTKDVLLQENVNFASLLLPTDIKKGLAESGFKKPSPIQFKAIPLGRCGFDLIVKSKSGTGKTLVFSTIALETVNVTKKQTQVLILVPTREIAVQIQSALQSIGRHINGLSVDCFIGGMPLEEDIRKASDCHIAVGAPGRVKHLITLGALSTKFVRLFVLDEADKLMETTFQSDINEIFDSLPQRKQLIATSATYPKELDTFLANYMLSPTHVTSENETPLLLGLKQFVAVLKANAINAVQQMKAKNEILLEIFSKVSFTQCLVFTNYQSRTESVCNYLNQKGWTSSFISAAIEQSERLEAINNLKNFKSRILLSTDLTSRGIDAPNVDLVINYDLPYDAVTYLHRMGRAGRYGSAGICINLALEAEITKLQIIIGSIGSTNLSISKLPPLNGSDLWQLDLNGLEQIWGIVSEEMSNEVSESIKKEVLALKQRGREKSKKGKKKKSEDMKTTLEELSKFEPLTNKEKDLQSSSCQDSENLLNSLINQEEKIKLEELKTEEEEMILPDNSLITNQEEQIKLEEFGKWRDVLKTEEEPEMNCFSSDSDNLLNSLITGENNDDDSKKRKRNKERKIKLEELDYSESIQSILDNKKKEFESSSEPSTSPISAQEEDSKKRKLSQKEETQQVTFIKNKALLSVTKLLYDSWSETDAGSVGEYLNILKQSDSEEILEHEGDVMEDIFKIGYECAVKKEERSWLSCLPVEEFQRFQEFCREEQVAVSSESENENDYEMEEYAAEEEVEGGENNDVALQWVPVENDDFVRCYDDCSNVLWQTGLSFESVSEFDNWFYHWQEQLQSVRNYVQQNLYVEEMSKYQQNRLSNK